MTAGFPGPIPRDVRRRRRSRVPIRTLVTVVALALTFAAGIALGQALNDNPRPGETRTSLRTLPPLEPDARTVTVTVTTP